MVTRDTNPWQNHSVQSAHGSRAKILQLLGKIQSVCAYFSLFLSLFVAIKIVFHFVVLCHAFCSWYTVNSCCFLLENAHIFPWQNAEFGLQFWAEFQRSIHAITPEPSWTICGENTKFIDQAKRPVWAQTNTFFHTGAEKTMRWEMMENHWFLWLTACIGCVNRKTGWTVPQFWNMSVLSDLLQLNGEVGTCLACTCCFGQGPKRNIFQWSSEQKNWIQFHAIMSFSRRLTLVWNISGMWSSMSTHVSFGRCVFHSWDWLLEPCWHMSRSFSPSLLALTLERKPPWLFWDNKNILWWCLCCDWNRVGTKKEQESCPSPKVQVQTTF